MYHPPMVGYGHHLCTGIFRQNAGKMNIIMSSPDPSIAPNTGTFMRPYMEDSYHKAKLRIYTNRYNMVGIVILYVF